MQRSAERQNLRVFMEPKRANAENKGGGVTLRPKLYRSVRDQGMQLGRTP